MVKNLRKKRLKYKDKKDKLDLREDLLKQLEDFDNNKPIEIKKDNEEINLKKEKRKDYDKYSKKGDLKEEICENSEIKEKISYFESKNIEKILKEEIISSSETEEEISSKFEEVVNIKGKIFQRDQKVENFRSTLPILDKESDIITALRKNKIVLIKGSTGCGKSTQMPQILLENGFKKILMTQPRRIAAIGVCSRINQELNKKICSYKIRYEDTTTKNTKVKIVTDGILLNELREDNSLKKYDVIIIDEAHERNTNLDLLIPILVKMAEKNLIKLVIMSATLNFPIDSKIFSMIEVEGKKFKVKIFNSNADDHIKGTVETLDKILKSESSVSLAVNENTSNVLIFLPSKKDIYSLKTLFEKKYKFCEVLPLHSNLPKEEQMKIFEITSKRKIILSTNIAETSITIPGIVYVIDCGLEKKKTFSDNIFEYKISLISKSSAIQRAGRAGREQPGVCYRLYGSAVFESMLENNTSEIKSLPFENGYLTLLSLNILPETFPYIEKPDLKYAKKNLKILGAIDEDSKLTEEGKLMLNLGIPVRLARIMLSDGVTDDLKFVIGILALNFDIKINKEFKDEKSDLIAKSKTILQNFESEIKHFPEFAKFLNFFKAKNFIFDQTSCDNIREILFKGYCDQIAMRTGDVYIFGNNIFHLDSGCCDIDSEYVVFEYIIKGRNKKYLKNVTSVDIDWL